MSSNEFDGCDVVVAGGGIAAAAMAIRLLSFGFRPLLLVARRTSNNHAAEALPKRAVRLLDALGMGSLLQGGCAVEVKDFETDWRDKPKSIRHDGLFHVERVNFARLALAEAVRRGAVIKYCSRLPRLHSGPEGVTVSFDNEARQFFAGVDATGRAAGWSRPVRRLGRRVADLFRLPQEGAMLRGKVATVDLGWAYRIDLPDYITVGIVSKDGLPQKRIDAQVTAKLSLPVVEAYYTGRRPAFPQWAEEPLSGRKLSVGDAAMAHDPVAGQGVLFALGSSMAAAAVIRTWRDATQNKPLADSYYKELIETEKLRHISALETLYSTSEQPDAAWHEFDGTNSNETGKSLPNAPIPQDSLSTTRLPETVRFIADTRLLGIQHEGLIVPGEAIILPNGGAVRWLGRFDLLLLKKFCPTKTPLSVLLERLSPEHCAQKEGVMLIRWCLSNSILAPGD